ncbi:bifunctional UDP-N-acetylmuramoyl-tripeptide:D-alanyl-D-alanine ligase/alanine racemase [Roseivirga sp. E12]|uniref:bifunctional UDP-N-acetylmuramoyl-tripeptide:D-alanyl-D-alanine ligase/alanine racemase n=1 Tax=Roseivirga sp. E12 TaxID=2819237 RepID=UPI001F3E8050|nr:bifunctional UDP-N-acetylmuramoyl-tripeptide:D-alanyl-D-alanine ligase/alanine racemase [Roseivirga sp. E12]
MKIGEIAKIVEASTWSEGSNSDIFDLSVDSRSAKGSSNELFIAIKGPNHDGHQFINELAKKGTRNFIVEEGVRPIPDCNILKVNSSIAALQKIAHAKRIQFKKEVIGITGSNGKTIVKEWLSTILSNNLDVLKSPKSYNSQVGVPLSVWPLSTHHDLAVFEAGISMPGEMENLAKVIEPSTGIFTNIGTAHDEHFGSQKEKIEEKLKLFEKSESLVFRADHSELSEVINKDYKGSKISWSTEPDIDSLVKVEASSPKNIKVLFKGDHYTFQSEFTDEASLENLIHSIVCALHLGLTPAQIQVGIAMISPIKMRLELKRGVNNTYLIDDTYNNDLAGLTKALDFMDQQQQLAKRSVILSDFVQNKSTNEFYAELNQLLLQKGIDKLIAIGPELSAHKKHFSLESKFYDNTESFLASLSKQSFQNELILIKGARQFAFERISKLLADKGHKTVLEINLDAVTHNLNYYKSLLKPETKVMVVVKALAYGAGSSEISKLLEFHKVDYLAVAYADEGVMLRQDGIKLPIMVMNASMDDPYKLIQYNLEPEIYSLEQLEAFLQAYQFANKILPAHLILNTGMNRLGFNETDLNPLIERIHNNPHIRIESVFSHLAASEEKAHESFTKEQITQFRQYADQIESALDYQPIRHILNSGGIIRHNADQENMVRLGIGLHGIEVSDLHADKLQNTSTLKTVISQLRTVKAGETIGYGRRGKAINDMAIATIAIGYADGYLRYFGNGAAYVSVNGQKAKTIGNICMDMTMIDVTGLSVEVGDEVVIFGSDPTVSQLAKWGDTIPYEVLTNVSNRVKRVFYSE